MARKKQVEQFYCYIWLRAKDGSPYYVGKTVHRNRVVGERHTVRPPKDTANIRLLDCASEADALKLEMLLIRIYGRKDIGTGILRNLTDGGDGKSGHVPSEETRAKISAVHKGNKYSLGHKHSQEARTNMSAARKGCKFSPEHRANMSAALKGRPVTPETRAKLSAANRGHAPSPETCAKIAAANMGRKHTPEARAKIARGNSGKIISDITRRKLSIAKTRQKSYVRSPETLKKQSEALKAAWVRRREEVANAA